MVKNKGGRPTKKDEIVIGKLEEIFMIDGTVGEACSNAGIDQSTYHDWIKSDIKFSKRITASKAFPFILARKTLMKGLKEGDQRSSIEYLKRRDKRYSDKSEVDNKHTIVTEEELMD